MYKFLIDSQENKRFAQSSKDHSKYSYCEESEKSLENVGRFVSHLKKNFIFQILKCLKALETPQFPIATKINNAITRLIDGIILGSGESGN